MAEKGGMEVKILTNSGLKSAPAPVAAFLSPLPSENKVGEQR